jgi:hypothetical protein
MAKKELTAIEWIIYKLPSDWTSPYADFIFEKGKAMEEKQIKDAWLSAWKDSMLNPLSDEHYQELADEYYNKIFQEQKSDMSEIPTTHSPSAKNAHTELIGKPEQFNFTKGEWIAERKSENQICHLIKTGERHTIHVYDSKYGIDEEESWANAKLIEKAPELLNILITICKLIKDEELEEIIHFPMLREAYTLIKEIATKSAIKREYRCDDCKDSGAVRVGEYEYSECPCLTDDRN